MAALWQQMRDDTAGICSLALVTPCAEHVWLHFSEILAVGLQQVPDPSRILSVSHRFRNYLLKKKN